MTTKDKSINIRIPRRKIRSLVNDNISSAEAVNLVYVSDRQKGIQRKVRADEFIYTVDNKAIRDKETLARIKSLVLPPAWKDVWICLSPNGHLQATGIDAKGRKQYKYHPLWNALRAETKFFHLYDFGSALPVIRKQVMKDLSLVGMPLQKVLAAIVALIENTGIRIGSSTYEKLYGSFGITTLKNQHVKISGNEMRFSFKGKKGVAQNITLKNKKLTAIIQKCKHIPGKELFQYYDENNEIRSVESGMVNEYIKEICGQNFTAKDFRTWVGTLCALEAFRELGCCETVTETKSKIVEALDIVSKRLGNTRTVCRKYYVHPVVIDHYSNNTLGRYSDMVEGTTGDSGLSTDEQILMKMLEKKDAVMIAS